MTDWQNVLYWTAIGYAATAGAALLAFVGLYLFVPALRRRWLPSPRLRPGTWTGHEVFLAFCTMMVLPILVIRILIPMGFFGPLIGPMPDLDPPGKAAQIYAARCAILSSPLTLTLTLGVLFAILFARAGCRPHHLGLSWARWPANLRLGILAFILTTPIVLGVHALAEFLANLMLPTRPHLFAQLSENTLYDWEWFLIAFQATVAAPLLEEIVFRGVLLGWLRRATLVGHLAIVSATVLWAAMGIWHEDRATQESVINVSPLLFALLLAGGYVWVLYRLSRRFGLAEDEIQIWRPLPSPPPLTASTEESRKAVRQHDEERLHAWSEANASLAIYGSAMLFALFHVDAWPAPIALLLLALLLGKLAQRTQSLIGPIALHALFNLVAFISLYGSVHYDISKNGNAQTTAAPVVSGASAISVPASQLPLRK